MRLDKYLKVSRIIKRRTVAKEACEGGRVSINGKVAKPSTVVKEGDIIAIDVGATYGGMVGDSAWSYRVGKVSDDVDKLMKVTEESLYEILEGEEDKE